MATIFVSPGVFTKEQDFTIFASRIGITRLGLVGKTLKGPAFEPIKIRTTDDFLLRFGSTDTNFPLPYVANSFLSQSNELVVTRILGSEGFVNSPAWIISADNSTGATGSQSGATLAIIRSKRNQVSGSFYFTQENEITIGAITSTLGSFMLSASTGPLTAQTNSGFTLSLDETSDDYIVKMLGKSPEVSVGTPNLYVERIYPHFVREASARGQISNINSSLIFSEQVDYTDFENKYTNAITPWIVSRVIGGDVRDLFRVQTVSDGDSANKEIKISISNIDIINYTFDVIVRRFDDTDASVSSTALERWSNVSLREEDFNYIAKVIGTTDESYPRKSTFITVDMAVNCPRNTSPAGFRGYELRASGISGTTSGNIYYKTDYFSGDSIFKTYLGVSELGYSSYTSSQVSTRTSIKTVEADLFAYDGGTSTGKTEIKGFHLENTANTNEFVSGNKNSLTAYTNDAQTLIDRNRLKFTLAPYGGFDGWDKYQSYSELYEEFTDVYSTNVNAFKSGLDEMANPEIVDINVLATPGVNFSNNNSIIRYALDIVEDRTDAIYVMDAPRFTSGTVKGTSEEVVSALESTGIDSNYAATYWPWIQIEDPNSGKFTYQAPTMMVVQTYALTDNVSAPWFAPAGLSRGLAGPQVIRADVRLNNNDRDTLYQGRVNPIATFVQQGVVIWGQKTLQVRQSALDRINIRRLLLQVRRLVSAASLTLLFEQNDQTLRDQFLAKVEPLLLQIQNQRGLTAFKVVMDDSNNTPDTIDRNTLVGKIQLQPTRTAEFISLDFQVLPTGANFSDF